MRDYSGYDAVVIGGGLAGAAAACHLAGARKSVVLFEKESTPRHKVCGEFLSAEAQAELRHLGIDIAELGAVPIRRVRLVRGGRSAEASLPFQAAGLSRFVLDDHLLQKAQTLGAHIVRGTPVRELVMDAVGGWSVTTQDQATVTARAAFLASGKHDLRQYKRERATPDRDIGFKIYLHLAPAQTEALRDAVEVVFFDGGYAGLQLIDRTTANLCLLVRKSLLMRLNKSWRDLLSHLTDSSAHLRTRLAGAMPCWDEPLAISSLPFGYLCDAREEPGLYRLGDQFSVIPAFAGNGISIALHTARLATTCFLHGDDGSAAYHQRARDHIGAPLRRASRLSRLSASPWAQSLAVQVCRAFPSVAAIAATVTRIQEIAGP